MIPALATAYVNHPDLFQGMWETVDVGIGHPIVVNNSDGNVPYFEAKRIEILGLGVNVGFSGAVNMICDRVFNQLDLPWVLIVGSDVRFARGDIKIFKETVNDHPAADFVFGNHSYGNFVIKRSGWDKVGAMDENLWPAFLEDGDHWRRIQMTGAKAIHCAGLRGTHTGSASVKDDNAFSRWVKDRQRINWGYYSRKHGCPEWSSAEETFKTPFNDPECPVNRWELSEERKKEPHYFSRWGFDESASTASQP